MDNEIEIVKLLENNEMNRYISELHDDIELNIQNLREKSLLLSSIRAKWLNYYYKEKENASRIKTTKTKYLQKKMSSVKATDSILRMKSEENLANNDETIKKLNTLAEVTKNNIEYIEHAMNILGEQNFSIKNAIECLKLEKI